MTALNIATAPRVNAETWHQTTITFDDLAKRFEQPADVKDCGAYVAGLLKPLDQSGRLRRNKDALVSRSAVTLDADAADPDLLDQVSASLDGLSWIAHTTWSSTPEAQRWRVVVPLSRDATPDEYRALSRYLRETTGVHQWDATCDEPERLMFWPSAKDPNAYRLHVQHGVPLPLDAWLADAALAEPEPVSELATKTKPTEPLPADYVHARVARYLNELRALADLPEGARDDHGDGWDAGYFRVACQLVRAGNSGYGLVAAEDAFYGNAATSRDFGSGQLTAKWESALRAVGDEGLSWSDPADDFEVVPPDAAPTVDTSGGWLPVDWDDDEPPPETELWHRTDGIGLLYPGMTHSIHGESESGKSMLIQSEVATLLKAGRRVLYLDYEAEKGSVGERLSLMGVTRAERVQWLDYVKPERDYAATSSTQAAFNRLMERRYALVVIDGVTEALTQAPPRQRTMAGLGGNDDIAVWDDRMPKLLARRTGAAVVMIDHVAKSAEAGRFAIGGQAKMANISGAAFLVRPGSPLGRGMVGSIDVYIAKDRHGFLRAHGGPYGKDNRLQLVATATVDGTEGLRVTLAPPVPEAAVESEKLDRLKSRICDFLVKLPNDVDPETDTGKKMLKLGPSKRQVQSGVTGNAQAIGVALDQLVESGVVTVKFDGQAHRHKLAAYFVPEFDAEPLPAS